MTREALLRDLRQMVAVLPCGRQRVAGGTCRAVGDTHYECEFMSVNSINGQSQYLMSNLYSQPTASSASCANSASATANTSTSSSASSTEGQAMQSFLQTLLSTQSSGNTTSPSGIGVTAVPSTQSPNATTASSHLSAHHLHGHRSSQGQGQLSSASPLGQNINTTA